MTRPHYIRHNKAFQSPSRIFIVDTETKPEKIGGGRKVHKLVIGAYIFARRVKNRWIEEFDFFNYPELFWTKVVEEAEKHKAVWVFAHNWHFDFQVLHGFEVLPRLGCWLSGTFAVDSSRFFLNYKCGKAMVKIVDSTNYFKVPLEEIAKLYGMEKVKVEDWEAADAKTLMERVEKDVYILYYIIRDLIDWWHSERFGKFAVTAAGLAWNAFRHRFMRHKILSHQNPKLEAAEREAYFGGRTEVFKWGRYQGRFYILDVNSMYPAVMRDGLYPIRPLGHVSDVSPREIARAPDKVVYNCLAYIETDVEIYPKRLQGAGLVFPVGRFVTRLIGPELKEAARRKHLAKAEDCYVYEAAPIFKEYVEYFWALRQKYKAEGDKVREQFAKLLLNSLYGKFGQWVRPLKALGTALMPRYLAADFVDVEAEKIGRFYQAGFEVFIQLKEKKSWENAVVAISATVTSYARLALWSFIETAGLENTYYVDTDSLMVDQEGLEKLRPLIGSNLGWLKLEKEADTVELRAPKDYTFGSVVKIKGVPKRAEEVADSIFAYSKITKVKTSLNEGSAEPIETLEIKILNRWVKKRVVLPDGSTEPLRLLEW
ncbi:DNA polymerase [Pyrobaculum sp.]|uniref:DNA polymerase n=1 Tax=Pyrobaculum sp. TaxID=2004705 RepID=UPI00317D88B5